MGIYTHNELDGSNVHENTHRIQIGTNLFLFMDIKLGWVFFSPFVPALLPALECDSTLAGYRFNEVHFSPCPDKSLYLFGTFRKANNVLLAFFCSSSTRDQPLFHLDFWFHLKTQRTTCLSTILKQICQDLDFNNLARCKQHEQGRNSEKKMSYNIAFYANHTLYEKLYNDNIRDVSI